MSVASSQMELFQTFLGEQKVRGIDFSTPEESVTAFRKHETEVAQLKSLIQPAIEQADRGEFVSFNPDDVKARMFQKVAGRGGNP